MKSRMSNPEEKNPMHAALFKISGSPFLAASALGAWLVAGQTSWAATIAAAVDPGISTAFDYTNLTNITPSHPQVSGSFDVRDMFGGNFGTGHAIFQDTGSATTYEVTFTLSNAFLLTGYNLYLQNDGDDLSRSLNRFQLLQGATILSDVSVTSAYNTAYGSHSIVIQDSFAPVTAATFTARFYGIASTFNGVRVHELDAVPEPTTNFLLGAAALALAFARRRARES